MKKLLLIVSASFLTIFAQVNDYYNYKWLNKNNITIGINNYGSLENYRQSNAAGLWNSETIIYDHGIWVTGKINNSPRAAVSQWSSAFSPGPLVNGRSASLVSPQDSLIYRVYKINKGDNNANPDYAEWPAESGAPVNPDGSPKIFGEQMLWSVFGFDTAFANSSRLAEMWSERFPYFPVEIQQTAFTHQGTLPDDSDILSNIIFFEWTVINKGSEQIDSAYISLWTDVDFSWPQNNIPAVDTLLQAGYSWSDESSPVIPPAVGYALLYGPVVPAEGTKAIFKGREITGYKNLGLSSFHPIGDDNFGQNSSYNPAYSITHAWNISRGLKPDGQQWLDPTTNTATTFPYSGDPVRNTQWEFPGSTGGGAGFNIFTGPFTMAPGDTQWVMMALVPGMGGNNLASIEKMRDKIITLRSLPYDSLVYSSSEIVAGINENVNPVEFKLNQNYPNPFNPVTLIEYSIPNVGTRHGVSVQLKIYDILGREVATLLNEEKAAGTYTVKFDASNLASGTYFYRLTAGNYVSVNKMLLLK